MLRKTIQWRKEFGLADLFEGKWNEVIAKENSTGKMYARGYDKTGHVVLYMKPVFENTNDHDGNLKHLVYNMERAIAAMKKPEEAVFCDGKVVLIIDYNGYSLSNAPPMKTSREVLNILQDHYPERLYRAYMIRPPYVFYGFYSIISPFIDPVTKDKICMLTNADMAKVGEGNKLYSEVERASLEPCAGGDEQREFKSEVYLSGAFHKEYNGVLEDLDRAVIAGKEAGKEAAVAAESVDTKTSEA
jgi:hypothetical protein